MDMSYSLGKTVHTRSLLERGLPILQYGYWLMESGELPGGHGIYTSVYIYLVRRVSGRFR